jgi:hypothetical protein
MALDDIQTAWLQTHKQLAGGGSACGVDDPPLPAGDTAALQLASFAGTPPTLSYLVPPAELAACAKYLVEHNLAAILIAGKTGLTYADYEMRLDDKPQGFYDVVDILMRQIPEGGLPNGPIRSAALTQVTQVAQDRFQTVLAKAVADRKASSSGGTSQPPADAKTDAAGQSTTLPIQPPPSTTHDDQEAEKLYEIDLDAVRTLRASKGGNVPPDPQFSLKITKHVEAWAKQSGGAKPTWTFKVLGDPSVALQSGRDFKPTDQFSVNILHLIWDSHLLPATELSLQGNASVFLDKQIGAQIELEQPLMSEVSFILDGTFDYGKGPNDGTTNYAITAGLEFKIFNFGSKKK